MLQSAAERTHFPRRSLVLQGESACQFGPAPAGHWSSEPFVHSSTWVVTHDGHQSVPLLSKTTEENASRGNDRFKLSCRNQIIRSQGGTRCPTASDADYRKMRIQELKECKLHVLGLMYSTYIHPQYMGCRPRGRSPGVELYVSTPSALRTP